MADRADDADIANDAVVTDSVDINDVSTDVAVSGDERQVDTKAFDSVDDAKKDNGDVSCGTCTGGKLCIDGECSCSATQKDCDGICTTLGTNENCSACSDECPAGGSCESGHCICPSGQADCSGICTPLGTDDNCSTCNDVCAGVKSCQNKECVAEVDHECLPSVPCVTDDDCVSGNRCNQAIFPPACQKLYCGGFGTACSEDYFCLSMICSDDACVNDCNNLECGPDPVYGESCGACQKGATCVSNSCRCEPQDHLECVAGKSTWIDSCGNVGEVKTGCPLECLNGACVECEVVGKTNCSGKCASLGTELNCSECGDVCPEEALCESGECVSIYDEYTVICSDGMCLIPSGSFWMGCNETVDNECSWNEEPYHEVQLDGYYIDQTEVPQSAYKMCVDAGSCNSPECAWNPSETPNHPVACVDWDEARAYCEWVGKRLPTEAEWEKAARGTDGRIYPWGNKTATCSYAVMTEPLPGESDVTDFYACGTHSSWDVCSKSPAGDSPYGLCDMAGNVSEWVSDWYDSNYYDVSPSSNPQGPNEGDERVVRGGQRNVWSTYLRTSMRGSFYYYWNFDTTGFRCAKDAE